MAKPAELELQAAAADLYANARQHVVEAAHVQSALSLRYAVDSQRLAASVSKCARVFAGIEPG
jgi:hypothetical protein